ncbi:MAG: hypothetical protein Q4B88_04390 [Moraxella sp.]|nr:hypothetical protein [Moraxella sp.]
MYQSVNTMGRHQAGVALIVVLLFLILITIAGAIAVRQSMVDLKVATSDQAGVLMLNASDSVLSHIEQAAGSPTAEGYAQITSQQNGILGYFMLQGQEKIGHQLSFCYRPANTDLYSRDTAFIRPLGVNTLNQTNGFCNPASATDYISGRNTAMTQVVVTGIDNALLNNFQAFTTRVSIGDIGNSYVPQVQMNSVSLLPAMSSVGNDTVTECLRRPVGRVADYGVSGPNMNECLKAAGVPANALVEEGVIEARQDGGFDAQTGRVDDVCASNAC